MLLVGLSAILASASAADASGDAVRGRSLLHFGDSLAVGTGIYLPSFLKGWAVTQSYDVSRHASSGPPGIRAFGNTLPRVIVVSLGANDSPSGVSAFEHDVEAVLRAAGSQRCVVWSTIVRPPYNGVSYDGLNAVLRRLDARRRNLVVFDWAKLAARNPQWFGNDGVHPSATGYRIRASAIAHLVRSDC